MPGSICDGSTGTLWRVRKPRGAKSTLFILSLSQFKPPHSPAASPHMSSVWAVLTLCFSSLKFPRSANCRCQMTKSPQRRGAVCATTDQISTLSYLLQTCGQMFFCFHRFDFFAADTQILFVSHTYTVRHVVKCKCKFRPLNYNKEIYKIYRF